MEPTPRRQGRPQVKFLLNSKDSKSYCLLILFHRPFIFNAKPPGLVLSLIYQTGSDGSNDSVLVVQKPDPKKSEQSWNFTQI